MARSVVLRTETDTDMETITEVLVYHDYLVREEIPSKIDPEKND